MKAEEAWQIEKLYRVSHRNVVPLIECFMWEEQIAFVYESFRVSLDDVLRCPYGPLSQPELASISQGVSHSRLRRSLCLFDRSCPEGYSYIKAYVVLAPS